MSLKNYQSQLTLGNLYQVIGKSVFSGSEQLSPSIYIDSGSIDVYTYNGATQPASKAAMTLNNNDTNVSGLNKMQLVPTYIYVEQNAGTSAEIIVSGLNVTDLGAI